MTSSEVTALILKYQIMENLPHPYVLLPGVLKILYMQSACFNSAY